jgi:acetyl esterase/lipase
VSDSFLRMYTPLPDGAPAHPDPPAPDGRTDPPAAAHPWRRATVRRTPLLITALLAAVGGAVVHLAALPALWRMSWPFGLLFAALGAAQLGTAVLVLRRPARWSVLGAAAAALAGVAVWVLTRLTGLLPGPDPWVPADSAIGFTDHLCAALEAIAVPGLAAAAALGTRPRPSRLRRVLSAAAVAPLAVVVLLGTGLGFAAASDGLPGAGLPAGAAAPRDLPPGERSTVEYCRPDGVPLAMDLYTPPAGAARPAPVVMYTHGGGLILGGRKTSGLGAALANPAGALFDPLRQRLNARGFVVASIDYRLPPATPWPGPLEDAKCAVRFLRAHASGLGIDPDRIGVWGSSSGGLLASLVGLAGPGAGFDQGEYPDRSSAVQAVVDMFGAADVDDLADSSPFLHFCLWVGVGGDTRVRHAMSPTTYVAPQAPPFLILHGDQDRDIRPRHSRELAGRLRAAGVTVTMIEVHGTGHTLDTPGEQPSPDRLADTVADFFTRTLAR